MKTAQVVLAGGSGYLGRILTAHFVAQGRPVVVLTRRMPVFAADSPLVRYVLWDGETLGEWTRELEGAAALINLAGRSVNCRYTERNQRDIYESRLCPTRVLGLALVHCRKDPPPVWLNASSATIYRHAEDRAMDEATGELGTGFSVDVCRTWEGELEIAPAPPTVRKVALRTAMVFGPGEDGVLEAFTRLARFGLGGSMAGGRQYVSWIHAADFAAAVEWLIGHPGLSGPVNLAAPEPVANAHLMQLLRQSCVRSFSLPTTRWMLQIGALLMGTEAELIVKSRRVIPGRLLASGFRFRFPNLEGAVANLLGGDRRRSTQTVAGVAGL